MCPPGRVRGPPEPTCGLRGDVTRRAASLRTVPSQVDLAGPLPALCSSPTSHLNRCQQTAKQLRWVRTANPAPERRGQRPRDGVWGREQGTPSHKCGACKPAEIERTASKDEGAGDRLPARGAQLDRSDPDSRPPSQDSDAKTPGHRGGPEAAEGDPEKLA